MKRSTRMALAGGVIGATLIAGTALARDVVVREDGRTFVNTPAARVVTDERTGETRVKVRAPDTRVDVDTQRGEVRIRVPYFNSDIRW